MSTAISWRFVMVVCTLTAAATETKIPSPATQTAIATISRTRGGVFVTHAVSSDAKTSATTPTGCTTIRGAKASAASCTRMARPNSALPPSQTGSRTSREKCAGPSPFPCAEVRATPRDCRKLPSVSRRADSTASAMPMIGNEVMVTGWLLSIARRPR